MKLSENTQLRDIDNSAGEKSLLYSIIAEGFEKLGDDRGVVDKLSMFRYVMKKSKGRFNPALVHHILSEYER